MALAVDRHDRAIAADLERERRRPPGKVPGIVEAETETVLVAVAVQLVHPGRQRPACRVPDEIRLDANAPAEFDHWMWVSYWYPLGQVVVFKREVYRKALLELAGRLPIMGRR